MRIALENDEKEAALPLAMNLYSLTGDEEMKKVIDDILDELDEGSGDDDDEDGE